MHTTAKPRPTKPIAPITFRQLDGGAFNFGAGAAWQTPIVIRGQHCPIWICNGESRVSDEVRRP